MEYAYSLSAKAPLMKKYRMDTGTSIIGGVPVIANSVAADDDGVAVATTTASLYTVGYSTDPASSTSAQVAAGGGDLSDGDNAGYVSLIINPDAVMRAKLTEGATEDTALTLITQASASAAGTTVGPTTTDEFTVWGYQGANEGKARRCTAANTVVNAFPFGIAAGDTFLEVGGNIGAIDHFPQLSTLLTQYNANAAADADNNNFIVVQFILNGISADGRNNSFADLVASSHVFGGNHTTWSTGIEGSG
jgi:hypothetical protein